MDDERLRALYSTGLSGRTPPSREVCPDAEALRAVAERGAPSDVTLDTLDHVSGCPSCQRELALLMHVADAKPRFLPSIPVWAVTAAAVVLLALGVRSTWERRAGEPVTRGGSGGPMLVSPADRSRSADVDALVWQSVPRATRYEVEVLAEDGSVVFEGTTRDTVTAMPPDVTAGVLYRWRVSAVLSDGTRLGSGLGSFTIGSP